MLRRMRSIKAGMHSKLLAKNMVTVASAFVWYFLAYNLITSLEESLEISPTSFEHLLIVGSGTVGIAVSALFGSLAINRFWKRDRFLPFWMLAGVFLSFIPLCVSPSSTGNLIAISTIFGCYFGLGMPSTMGFFASSTDTENRGRTGGIAFLAIGLSFFVLGNLGVGSVITATIVLATIRLTGLVSSFLLRSEEEPLLEHGRSTYKEVLQSRSFALFFAPWIMFNLVDYLTIPVLNQLTPVGVLRDFTAFENGLIAVVAIVTGFLVDMKGRKRLAIFGFAFLGIGYATLGFFPNTNGLILFTVADGIAWGSFNVLFLFTLWGDIANGRSSEKFYVMGALPYLFSNLMYLLAEPLMAGVGPAQAFTFASFFLFLAVLPLVYAPETLPEKAMKQRELKIYIEKAQEIAQKYY
jgi:MFS family permease